MSLTLERAQAQLTAALAESRRRQLPPMALVVLDARGQIKAAASEDGVGLLRHAIALGKAKAALGMGFDTAQFDHLLRRGVLSEAFSAALACASGGDFNPNPGGLLIREAGEVVGAVGASGAAAEDDHRLWADVIAAW